MLLCLFININTLMSKATDKSNKYFKLIYIKNNQLYKHGRYSGKTYKQAAQRAFSQLSKKNNECLYVFCIEDYTEESEFFGTKYIYIGEQKPLNEPHEIVINKGLPNEEKIIYVNENKLKLIQQIVCNDNQLLDLMERIKDEHNQIIE